MPARSLTALLVVPDHSAAHSRLAAYGADLALDTPGPSVSAWSRGCGGELIRGCPRVDTTVATFLRAGENETAIHLPGHESRHRCSWTLVSGRHFLHVSRDERFSLEYSWCSVAGSAVRFGHISNPQDLNSAHPEIFSRYLSGRCKIPLGHHKLAHRLVKPWDARVFGFHSTDNSQLGLYCIFCGGVCIDLSPSAPG